MPQEKSVYGDTITDKTDTRDSDSQATPNAEEVEPGEEQTPVTDESRTAAETTPDITTPHQLQHKPRPTSGPTRPAPQETTPIRATVTAEKAAEKGAINQEKGKNELKGLNKKKY